MSPEKPEWVSYGISEEEMEETDRFLETRRKVRELNENLAKGAAFIPSALVGGWGASNAIYGTQGRTSVGEELSRYKYLDDNRELFKDTDSGLRKAYGLEGLPGLADNIDRVWADQIGKGTDYVPADISQSGKFKPANKTILTVTPEPNSSRFAARFADEGIGGGSSATLWGNLEYPQYSYVQGNLAEGAVNSQNPSVHFSEVNLPPEEKTDYKTTSEVKTEAKYKPETRRGWGVASNQDTHFGKEHVLNRGRTTAADIYTYLKQQGVDTPIMGVDAAENLQNLTESLQNATGAATEFDALQSIASPVPTFGNSDRFAGTLPILEYFDTASSPNKEKAGIGSFFLENENVDQKIASTGYGPEAGEIGRPVSSPSLTRNNSKFGLRFNPDLPDGQNMITGFWGGVTDQNPMVRNFGGGVLGTAVTSPETAKALREGDFIKAGGILGSSYVGGEVASAGLNRGAQLLSRKGLTNFASLLPTVGRVMTPLAVRDGISAATTLATGKTPEELIVESGNAEAGIAQAMAPMTTAPLGMAGHINATLPIDADTQARAVTRQQNTKAKIQKAKERGGRWGIGPFRLPEFGITERASAPLLSDVKREKVMAVLNGKEGYMLQGDPTSFRMANWSDDARKRYYGK